MKIDYVVFPPVTVTSTYWLFPAGLSGTLNTVDTVFVTGPRFAR